MVLDFLRSQTPPSSTVNVWRTHVLRLSRSRTAGKQRRRVEELKKHFSTRVLRRQGQIGVTFRGTGGLAETKCAREDEDDSKLKLDAKQGARPELEIWRGNLAHIFTCNSLLLGKREHQSVRTVIPSVSNHPSAVPVLDSDSLEVEIYWHSILTAVHG